MNTAIIFDIQRNSFVDGPGIRTTVFFKGCNLKCKWCHNPESQSTQKQMMYYKDKCIGCGKCAEVCPNQLKKCDFCGKCELYCPADARKVCGKEYSAIEVFNEIAKDKIFYENSGGGVTFSGGECMLQTDFLCEILQKCKQEHIHTAIDTAGFVPWESFERVLPYTDLFLYDIKTLKDDVHKEFTGVSNKPILSNLRKLLEVKANVWIRIPIIPNVNDSAENMKDVKAFLDAFKPIKTELLPYHKMGEHKYTALGRKMTSFEVPTKEKLDELNKILQNT